MALNQCKRCGQFRGASHRCLPKHARNAGSSAPTSGVVSRVPAAGYAPSGSRPTDYSAAYMKFRERASAVSVSSDVGAGLSAGSGVGARPVAHQSAADREVLSSYSTVEKARVVLSTPDSSGAAFRPRNAGAAIDDVVRSVVSHPEGSGVYGPAVFDAETRRQARGLANRSSSSAAGVDVPDYFAYNPSTGGYHYLRPEVAGFLQRAHGEAAVAARAVQQRSVGSAAGVQGLLKAPAAA